MLKDRITGAKAMMRALQAEGVKTIFGYPGGAIMPVYDALFDYTRGEKKCFDHILVRHEQGATHAAEGYARVSGEVGVALVTSGPGVTNTLTGIADAMMDSTPMVVIAGQVPISALGSDAFQEVDLVGVSQPISKWSYQIRRAEDVAWAVSRAFYIARTGRPGPVVLDFSKNAQTEEIDWEPQKVNFIRSYVPYPKLDHEAVRQAAELINNAKKPLALVGQGVELGNAQEELKRFLEKADIPAGRTMLGLSALPSNHPLNVGMLGMHGNYAVNMKEQECDVLIAIGMRFSDRVTGNVKTYAKQAKIIHLDIDRSEIDKCVKTDIAVVADCKESLPALTELINKNKHQEWIESFKPLDEKERVKVIEPAIHPKEGPLRMGEVVNAVAEQVPDDAMGYGMPAAIGATFAAPERCVCCFMGDGGFQMCIEELGTIMEQKSPVKMILMNNHYLGNVRQWQDMFWLRRKSFTKMMNPNYELIAQGYGIPYQAVVDRQDLQAAVAKMLATEGPYILECAILEEDNVLPMTPPGMNVDQMMLEI